MYTVQPFSLPNYRKNSSKTPTGTLPCGICGRPVVTATAKHWAPVGDGGCIWGHQDDDSGDMGFFPIGNDCHRKYRVKG